MLDAGALEKQIRGLPADKAAKLLSEALNHALDTDPEFFLKQNWEAAFPALVWLAQRDPVRIDVFFERFEKKYDRSNTEWARKAMKHRVMLLQREKQLKALSKEELEAQIVFVSLLPGGKPTAEPEQEALIRALLVSQPERACHLAANWWSGGWQFDETVQLIFGACWQKHPEALLSLLTAWRGSQRENLLTLWLERVAQQRGSAAAPWMIRLLESMQNSIDRRAVAAIIKILPAWGQAERRSVLAALHPVLLSTFGYLGGDRPGSAVQTVKTLWPLDSGSEWELKLHALLGRMDATDRLRAARRLKRTAGIGLSFARAAHALAILGRRGKTLQDYLNRKFVRPDHRRKWRRFLALESRIQAVEDEMLKAELLKIHKTVVKETSKARKGVILAALNTDSETPIRVVNK